VSKNNLEYFPNVICEMPALEALHIFNNFFSFFPSSFKNL
jgi:hypothetical protein